MTDRLHLLYVVALLAETPDEKVSIGQVGTIVEELTDDMYEVEFADAKGRTLTTCAVEAKYLLKLWHELATQPFSNHYNKDHPILHQLLILLLPILHNA
ncbi:DUF4926 domain-containing protein [Spirosoma soli]|uniref:DUF4926 domain-containing protein n=1 Tax=Spirosoma soli TaxID=1770529 RepID=A0ABW5M7L4_9BACT